MVTFIIRIARVTATGLRGRAEHVRSGERIGFSSSEELVRFVRQMVAVEPRDETAPGIVEDDLTRDGSGREGRRAAPGGARGRARSGECDRATGLPPAP